MLTVSNYHYIRESFNAKYPSIFGITPLVFEKQLLLLKNEGDFVGIQDLIANYEEIVRSKNNYFLVTYDDGLKEQYQYALPILDKLEIPAVFFANSRNFKDKKVSTVHKIHLIRSIISSSDFLDKIRKQDNSIVMTHLDGIKASEIYIYDDKESAAIKYLLNFKMDFTVQEEIIGNVFDNFFNEKEVLEKLYMSEKEIIDLSRSFFLGSHTHNHYPIGLLEENEARLELSISKLYFEDLTDTTIELVSYPYGSPEACDDKVAEMAKQVGYKFGFTTSRGKNTQENNCLLLNRFDCNDLPGGKNYK